MVWVLGLLTLGALIWLIAGMMATESEAERRRLSQCCTSGRRRGRNFSVG